MDLRRIWQRARRFVPVRLYPLLAPVYRWDQRRTVSRLNEQDEEFKRQNPGVVFPDAELRANVVGPCGAADFLESGRQTCEDIAAAVCEVGASLAGVAKALDFGCGCGRLLQEAARRWPRIAWYGCDVDHRAVGWCQEHVSLATTVRNAELPPLPFQNEEFDLVWCGSVFTHLDESRQDAWLTELRRVLAPGGLLLASVHGPACWSGLPPQTVRKIREDGFVFARTGGDEGVHPDWYQTAWHSQQYIRSHWSGFLEIAAYIPERFNGYQDVVVARNAKASPTSLV